MRLTQSGLDAVPAARPLRTVTNADTSCAALLQWKPIRVPYQNHEDELMSKRTDISPEEVSACVNIRTAPLGYPCCSLALGKKKVMKLLESAGERSKGFAVRCACPFARPSSPLPAEGRCVRSQLGCNQPRLVRTGERHPHRMALRGFRPAPCRHTVVSQTLLAVLIRQRSVVNGLPGCNPACP